MERTCASCSPINNSARQFVAWEKQGRQRVLKHSRGEGSCLTGKNTSQYQATPNNGGQLALDMEYIQYQTKMDKRYNRNRKVHMIVAVIDGMGGGIGAQIVTQLRQELPLEVEILALGTNAIATDRMMKARANRGASGENAIHVSIDKADFILAPIGVVIPNSMMGEVTSVIAESIAGAPGRKLLLPINQPHFEIVGIEWKALTKQISAAIEIIRQALEMDGD